jgi:Ca2+-binding EF-hand superfamily protein
MTLRKFVIRTCVVALALGFGAVMSRGARANEDMEAKFKQMDTNGDGKVSADEHAAAAKTKFQKMDANGDGKVTSTELESAHEKMMGGKGKPEHMSSTEKIKMMDTNGDGSLSEDEFESGSQKMFEKMDANGDGYVTKDELKSGMQKMKERSEKAPSSK